MFVLSMKASRRRMIPAVLCIALIAAMLIASLFFPADRTMISAANTVAGDSDEACAAFLKTLGYTAVLPAAAVREVLLPDTFEGALADYNVLQQQAGFDLSMYAGQRVKYRTFDLSDHPSGQSAQANIYVYNGMIVGGDISAVSGDFCEPLAKSASASC